MTLTETASFTKKAIITFIIVLILGIAGWLGWRYYWYNYIYLPSIQVKAVEPDVKFGILPYPSLIKNTISPSNYSYTIDSPTGTLPADLPKIMDVYFIPKTTITLLAPDRAKELASSFGFKVGPQINSATGYQFSDETGGVFLIDLETLNFKFRRNIATDSAQPTDSTQLMSQTLPTKEQIVTEFKQMLEQRNLLNPDLNSGRSDVVYNQGEQAISNSATVSLWQANIGQYQIITPQFNNGLVKSVITKYTGENHYAALNYIFWPIDLNQKATYYIKTVDQALTDLKSGQGTIISVPDGANISVVNAYLAYLLPEEYTPFLQPVYVFEGPDFNAIVPAITSEYLKP